MTIGVIIIGIKMWDCYADGGSDGGDDFLSFINVVY
jgi:hypothetical protein